MSSSYLNPEIFNLLSEFYSPLIISRRTEQT
jgi:hypothetical protein